VLRRRPGDVHGAGLADRADSPIFALLGRNHGDRLAPCAGDSLRARLGG
jgi:hypothetical protein